MAREYMWVKISGPLTWHNYGIVFLLNARVYLIKRVERTLSRLYFPNKTDFPPNSPLCQLTRILIIKQTKKIPPDIVHLLHRGIKNFGFTENSRETSARVAL